jgi:hypothetical protein
MHFNSLIISLTLFSFIPDTLQSQPSLIWGKQFGTDKEEYVMNHVADPSGNFYICGKTYGSFNGQNKGNNDGFIMKVDGKGNMIWQSQYGSAGEENEQWCTIDRDANVYITGSTTGDLACKNHGLEDIYITKFDKDGRQVWTVQYGTDSIDAGQSVFVNGDDIYVTGTTSGKFGDELKGKSDCFIMKLNPQGEIAWIRQFGTPADEHATGISIFDHAIFVCGNTWGDLGGNNAGFLDCFTGEFDLSGKPLKFNQFGTPGFDLAMNMLAEQDGLFVCGSTSDSLAANQQGEGDAYIVKMKRTGEIAWKSQFGTCLHDGARCIATNNNFPDLVLVSGLQHLPPAQGFIRAYNKNGAFLWEKTVSALEGDMNTSGKSVILDNSGRITHTGLTSSSAFGTLIGVTDFYIVSYQLK